MAIWLLFILFPGLESFIYVTLGLIIFNILLGIAGWLKDVCTENSLGLYNYKDRKKFHIAINLFLTIEYFFFIPIFITIYYLWIIDATNHKINSIRLFDTSILPVLNTTLLVASSYIITIYHYL